MRTLVRSLVAICIATTHISCSTSTPPGSLPPTESVTTTSSAEPLIGPVGVGVHRDRFGVGAMIHTTGQNGVRDIELSIRFRAGDKLVLSTTDSLAFCPADSVCPWGTSFGITDDEQRSITSADVAVSGVGSTFYTGVVRPLDLELTDGAMSFELPARTGVAILYAVQDGAPYFGMFTTHQSGEKMTMRLTDEFLPVGPDTRAVFYEGHIPESMLAGRD